MLGRLRDLGIWAMVLLGLVVPSAPGAGRDKHKEKNREWSIGGIVRDPAGQGLEGVRVILVRVDYVAVVDTTVTNSLGHFNFREVSPGNYWVDVFMNGYTVRSRSQMVADLVEKKSAAVNFSLMTGTRKQVSDLPALNLDPNTLIGKISVPSLGN